MKVLDRLRSWASALKRDALTLWFCARHPETPWLAKTLALALAAYAFSPIDLIPDFIPVLGLLDEVVLLPLGIALCLKLVPPSLMLECRDRARAWLASSGTRPRSYAAAAVIVLVWLLALWLCWRALR
ncbi:MAG: DUF1232 domain-containing protein [Betaproteobacteria bacterium]|nr:DUF1232 domain-containing protein [Betaproteobacteria bacterium]